MRGPRFASRNSLLFVKASSKTGEGVREAFVKLAGDMVTRSRPAKDPSLRIYTRNFGNATGRFVEVD